jgi:hypothetical protein
MFPDVPQTLRVIPNMRIVMPSQADGFAIA